MWMASDLSIVIGATIAENFADCLFRPTIYPEEVMSVLEDNLKYFTQQQCSAQWMAFLHAFADEFGQQIPVAELRVLMSRLGTAMMRELPTPTGETLAELEASINAIWFDLDWGWVALIEKDDGLYIEHNAAPLLGAFGAAALAWSPALLEGIYAHWLTALGVDSGLQLSQVEAEPTESMAIVFRFGRAV
ncbi:MAG TPA: cellulose synthase [Gallionella sp.]|nr:MAG: cellulose synthase [Gallionellales bacterium CG17_big_fil_post_rev_8_21_14_2_50_54_146]HCJ51624.1 cellulose synthase [Gallionella sp.]